MNQDGTEKKLQALFSELKREDERHAPAFAQMFVRETREKKNAIRFRLAFVSLMVLVCAFTFIWFSQTRKQEALNSVEAFPQLDTTMEFPVIDKAVEVPKVSRVHPIASALFQARVRRPTKPRKKEIQKELSASDLIAWKSPTESLLQTPLTGLLKKVSIEEPKLMLGLPQK